MNNHPIILFDGVCNFCNNAINFIIRQDKNDQFRFTPLQSQTGKRILEEFNLSASAMESFVLADKNKIYQRSTAVLKICSQLPWYWRWTQLFWAIPRPVRDAVYNLIARNRYKWFGKKEQCMVPTAALRNRFLD